jgi:hypothetical protein
MKKDTKLQIPITSDFKASLQDKADDMGFSTVNELARVVIHNFIKGRIEFEFIQKGLDSAKVLPEYIYDRHYPEQKS